MVEKPFPQPSTQRIISIVGEDAPKDANIQEAVCTFCNEAESHDVFHALSCITHNWT